MNSHVGRVKGAGRLRRAGLWAALALCLCVTSARAQSTKAGMPNAGGPAGNVSGNADQVIKQVRLDQRLNNDVPKDVVFRDQDGKTAPFGEFLGKKPVLLMLIQYRCTMLCSEEMKILAESLKEMEFTVGKQFDVIIVSIDDREGPELAAQYAAGYTKEYNRPGSEAGWHFLTGSKDSILKLADSIGYHFVYDPKTDQFAHPDGVIVLTPAGRVARYFFRLNYDPRDMRLALVEAANNKIGTALDAFALLCYHYDPVTGKYGLAVIKLVRMASIVTVLVLALGIVVLKQRDRATRRSGGA